MIDESVLAILTLITFALGVIEIFIILQLGKNPIFLFLDYIIMLNESILKRFGVLHGTSKLEKRTSYWSFGPDGEETDEEDDDDVFDFLNLPPEVRLMIYQRMEHISRIQMKSIAEFNDVELIDEASENIKLMLLYTTDLPSDSMGVKYEKDGFTYEEEYTGEDFLDVLRDICYYYLREVSPVASNRVEIKGSMESDVVTIEVHDIDDIKVLTITTEGDTNVVRILKHIRFLGIFSDTRVDQKLFDYKKTKAAFWVEIRGECEISDDQLYSLECDKIHLNIPGFDVVLLKEYIINVSNGVINPQLDSLRVRTTKRNTAIFVREMLKIQSQNHVNSPIFKSYVNRRYYVDCFAGDDEVGKAVFCFRGSARKMAVYVTRSEIKVIITKFNE